MSLKNCLKCKKLFSPTQGQIICKECMILEREDFEKVRAFVRANPSTDLNYVSSQTGVSYKKILRYIQEGKIETSSTGNIKIQCQKCGVEIQKGRYCAKCTQEMSKQFMNAITKDKETDEHGPKMHTNNKK